MSTRKAKSKKGKNDNPKFLISAILAMGLGYFLLNYVATWEDPWLGNTFHIIAGCTLIAVSFIVIVAILKKIYFPKKRRKKSKPIFLDDNNKKVSR